MKIKTEIWKYVDMLERLCLVVQLFSPRRIKNSFHFSRCTPKVIQKTFGVHFIIDKVNKVGIKFKLNERAGNTELNTISM